MTSPKKPSKETPLPSQDEARRGNVLMEQMLSKFDAFGEVLSAVREDVKSMKPDLHAVKEDVAVLKAEARSRTDALKANTEAIRAVQTDLKNINQRVCWGTLLPCCLILGAFVKATRQQRPRFLTF